MTPDAAELERRTGAILARLRDSADGVRRAVREDRMPDSPAIRPPLDQPERVHGGFVLSRKDVYEAIEAAEAIEKILRRRWASKSSESRPSDDAARPEGDGGSAAKP